MHYAALVTIYSQRRPNFRGGAFYALSEPLGPSIQLPTEIRATEARTEMQKYRARARARMRETEKGRVARNRDATRA